jgi:hypothetical protein
VRRVQRDGPHQIGPNRTENERNIHNVKERKEEKRIWKKTAADDELGMPGDVQKRIRWPALCVGLPDFQ